MLTTTLKEIRGCVPCIEGWRKLLEYLGKTEADDTPLPLETILESNGLSDALWALRAVDGHQGAMRLYACYCARQVLPVFERWLPGDNRLRQAIETAERFAVGRASVTELEAARTACVAAWDAARDAARDAAWDAARDAAWDAAQAAAQAAAWDAAWDASDAACAAVRAAARDAAHAAAHAAARAAARDAAQDAAQDAASADFKREFIRLCRLEGEYGEVSSREAAKREKKKGGRE